MDKSYISNKQYLFTVKHELDLWKLYSVQTTGRLICQEKSHGQAD